MPANQARESCRAVDDSATLARAARIVRAALARQKLSLAEPAPVPPRTASGDGHAA